MIFNVFSCRFVKFFFLIFFLIGLVTNANAEICDCDSQIVGQVPLFDSAVHLTDLEKIEAIETHLPWGLPKMPAGATNELLIIQRYFISNYDADLNTPTWVAYRLTADDIDENQPGYVDRLDCFRDFPPYLLADSTPPVCADYDDDSFDRGHLVNSNDMRRSRVANANTFFLTNMAPQFANFNRKIWRTLEDRVNSWAKSKGRIYVITGAIFDQDNNEQRDSDSDVQRNDGHARIAVASHFYKIILHPKADGTIETISIILPHNNQSVIGDDRWPYLKNHIFTIAKIEKMTGINFLPDLEIVNSNKASTVRNAKAADLWPAN
ncbi:DNA/RNA non-specific endonuclease [bacterium]|nr:DNA/RNA non-specific endonuclease [bacterium]